MTSTPFDPIAPMALLANPRAARSRHRTLLDALEAGARDHSPLVTFHRDAAPVHLDFAALLEGAHAWSATLRRRGIEHGSRVLVLLPTGPTFLEAFFGIMLLGAIPVPLASPMTFGSLARYLANLRAIARDAEADHLVTSPRVRDELLRDATLAPEVSAVLTEPDADARHARKRSPNVDANTPAFIQYTSGTTGQPKGVVVTHRALVANAFAIADGIGLRADDVGVSWLPLFHDMGLIGVVLTAVCHPYPLHVISPEQFVMRPNAWPRLLSRTGGTISASPNFGYELCSSKTQDVAALRLDRWRLALNGSEPIHPATIDRFCARMEPAGFRATAMLPVYGMAESTLAVTFATPGQGVSSLRIDRTSLENAKTAVPSLSPDAVEAVSVGRPVAGTSVRIATDGGIVHREGEVGEIQVSGPSLMAGYFRNDEATERSFCDEWLRTGDLGFVHDGQLYVVGRAREMIIKGGRNYYPHDVERIASSIEGVNPGAVAAFGRTNSKRGTEDLVVVVETTVRDASSRDRLRTQIRGELLAVLGIGPDEVTFTRPGALPRTTSGKIQRTACAATLARETDG